MGAIVAFIAVIILVLIVLAGTGAANLHFLLGVIIPYLTFVTFTIGVAYRVVKWGRSPVPFRIPTTAGQQKSLSWIKDSKLDNPSTTTGVIGRMGLEVLLFVHSSEIQAANYIMEASLPTNGKNGCGWEALPFTGHFLLS